STTMASMTGSEKRMLPCTTGGMFGPFWTTSSSNTAFTEPKEILIPVLSFQSLVQPAGRPFRDMVGCAAHDYTTPSNRHQAEVPRVYTEEVPRAHSRPQSPSLAYHARSVIS